MSEAQLAELLQGLLWTFEDREHVALYMSLCEAKAVATEARKRAEAYAAA